jgi:mycothiol synthase
MPLRPVRLPDDWPALARLLDEIEHLDGYDALTEDAYLAIEASSLPQGLVAVEDGDPTGFAHLRRTGEATVIEVAVHPSCRPVQAHLLLQAAVTRAGDGETRLWASDDETVAAAEELGFRETRRLVQMVRPLPPDETPALPPRFQVAALRRGADEDAVLAVNNAAFAGHPDNGGWTREILDGRMARRWFDPRGLLLARREGEPAGFCWTKMHPGAVGEIYVIAVLPRLQGQGLATGLALLGLWDLHDRKGARSATLFTESGNERARRLYERLGFEVLRSKRHLERSSAPAGDRPGG